MQSQQASQQPVSQWLLGGLDRYEPFLPFLMTLGTIIAGSLAAYVVVNRPHLFHFEFTLRNMLGGLAGLVLVGLMLRDRTFALVVLVLMVYLNLSEVLVRYYGLPSLLQLLAVPLLVRVWIDRRGAAPWQVSHEVLTWLLMAYTLVLFCTRLVAADEELAAEQISHNVKATVIFFIVSWLAATPRLIRTATVTIVAAGSVVGGLAMLQALTDVEWIDNLVFMRVEQAHIVGDDFEARIGGPVGDPNFFGQILVMIVPLVACLLNQARTGWQRCWILSGGVLIVGATVQTYSRGAAIALVVVIFLSALSFVPPKRKSLVVVVLVGGFFLLPQNFVERVKTIRELLPSGETETIRPDSSIQVRRLLNQVAWRQFLGNPLIGVGVGSYSARFSEYSGEVSSAARSYKDPGARRYPHSLYLEIAAETGALGLTTFGLVLVACFAMLSGARRDLLATGDPTTACFARALQIALVAYLVTSLFLHGEFARYLWMVFGFASAVYRTSTPGNVVGAVPR